MKNKSVHSCRFVHHAKLHCIMTTLNRLFKIEIQRGGELEKSLTLIAGQYVALFPVVLTSVALNRNRVSFTELSVHS